MRLNACSLHRINLRIIYIVAPNPTPGRLIEMWEKYIHKSEKNQLYIPSGPCGTRTHNLLLTGQGHYYCAMGELSRRSELLSNKVGEQSLLPSGRDHESMS